MLEDAMLKHMSTNMIQDSKNLFLAADCNNRQGVKYVAIGSCDLHIVIKIAIDQRFEPCQNDR